jgi:hypothetical protein
VFVGSQAGLSVVFRGMGRSISLRSKVVGGSVLFIACYFLLLCVFVVQISQPKGGRFDRWHPPYEPPPVREECSDYDMYDWPTNNKGGAGWRGGEEGEVGFHKIKPSAQKPVRFVAVQSVSVCFGRVKANGERCGGAHTQVNSGGLSKT